MEHFQISLSFPYPRCDAKGSLGRLLRWCFSAEAGTNAEISATAGEFMRLVEKESATISKICFSYAGSVAEYDDLRQDALINIWRGLKQFRKEASVRTWIYRVTVNSCLTTIRRLERHQHEGLEQLYCLIADDGEGRESIELMHRIINELGLTDRAIVMMWLDEMTYEEIAQATGLNRNTVATRLRRIKEKIAKLYIKNL